MPGRGRATAEPVRFTSVLVVVLLFIRIYAIERMLKHLDDEVGAVEEGRALPNGAMQFLVFEPLPLHEIESRLVVSSILRAFFVCFATTCFQPLKFLELGVLVGL